MSGRGTSTRLIVGLLDKYIGRLASMLAPWLISFIVCPIFSIIFYLLWNKQVFWVTIGFTICGSILTWLTHKLSRTRRKLGRWHGTITMFACLSWIYAATLNGPWTRPTFDIGFALAILLSMTWTMRGAIRPGSMERGIVRWPEASENMGLSNSTWRTLSSSNSNKLSGIITTEPGRQSFDDVKNKRGLLASLFDAPENGVRITKTDSHGQARIDIVREDFLKEEVPWRMPEFYGMSITDGPILMGMYEDHEPVYLNLYSPQGARHLMISGMNGSGKSVAARVLLADLFSRYDVDVYAIDVVKGQQTLGSISGGFTRFITEKAEATEFMHEVSDLIKERADILGMHGFDSWTQEAYKSLGMRFVVVLIEEAPAVVKNAAAFTRLVEQARSAGISIIVSIQRASYSNIPTDARAQLGSVLCFGVRDSQDAKFALGSDLVERGADPSLWQQSKPGYAYFHAPDISEERQFVPLRTSNISQRQLMNLAPEVKEDIPRRMTPNQAKEELTAFIKNIEGEFTPKDLYPILGRVGRKRPWLHTELKRRIEEGKLVYVKGKYRKA